MGDDREARALGAGDTVEVNGSTFKLRPVTARNLCELERNALREYKRQYIETYKDSLDILERDMGESLLASKLDEVARWDVQNLPQKDVYDTSRIPINDTIKEWVASEFLIEDASDSICLAVLSTALDTGKITPEKVKEFSGQLPFKGRVRYDQWWVTSTINGMVSFIQSSLEGTKEEKESVSSWPFPRIIEAARKVEKLTVADLGNG